jgi:hypothetical protein
VGGRFALGCTNTSPLGSGSHPSSSGLGSPPSSDSSRVEMWYVARPAREKKPVVLIDMESNDDSTSK